MVKNITLCVDEELFFKMKTDKAKKEEIRGDKITWEDYIKLIFGFSKAVEK